MNSFYGKYYAYENGVVVPKEQHDKALVVNDSWIKPEYSVVSCGTEHWQLQQEKATYNAGYISIGRSIEYVVAPTPHGAYFNKANPQNLTVTTLVGIKQISVARFQLMAAYSLLKILKNNQKYTEVSIIGSGAVAIGAALEFLRHNFKVKIFTRRVDVVQKLLCELDIEVLGMTENAPTNFIVDCVGTEQSFNFTIKTSKPNSVIGILGSPRGYFQIDLYLIHKKGLSLIGLHELNNFESTVRQVLFQEICSWLSSFRTFPDSWFQFKDSDEFRQTMSSLHIYRTSAPFLIFKW